MPAAIRPGDPEQVRDLFDRIAPSYDRLNDTLSLGLHRLWKAYTVQVAGLKEGDQIDLVKDDGQVRVRRLARADEVLTGLRRFRGKLPAAERLSRDDAHER